jgi:phosphatidate cytidylyltransferase
MLTTRLWMGSVLVVLTLGMLIADQYLPPWYPFLLMSLLCLAVFACRECVQLLGPERAPQVPVCYAGVVALALANWLVHIPGSRPDPWGWLLAILTGLVLVVFLYEMAQFTGSGRSMERMALTLWIVLYLGLLPCFFAQLRWLDTSGISRPAPNASAGSVALAMAIFVPKGCDIGAYFTGRLIGRHRMTPVLSPKKTWEGAVGGLVLAAAAAVAIDRLGPAALLRENLLLEIGFGLTVGMAGMLGDLAESLIKRDCQRKDASHAVPGFGGVLDVVDAVIFAAPPAYGWFTLVRLSDTV